MGGIVLIYSNDFCVESGRNPDEIWMLGAGCRWDLGGCSWFSRVNSVIFVPNLGGIQIRFGHSFFKVHPFGTSKNAHFGQIWPKCTFLAFWRYPVPCTSKTTFSFFAHFYTSNFALFCRKNQFCHLQKCSFFYRYLQDMIAIKLHCILYYQFLRHSATLTWFWESKC